MQIKLTKSKSKTIKNKYELTVRYMSGDADAYESVAYSFKTEEELLKIYSLFNRIFKFQNKYHNLFCDVLSERIEKEYQEIINNELLMGEAESYRDLMDKYNIDTSNDVTCQGRDAWPNNIVSMYYWDKDGIKYDITVEE